MIEAHEYFTFLTWSFCFYVIIFKQIAHLPSFLKLTTIRKFFYSIKFRRLFSERDLRRSFETACFFSWTYSNDKPTSSKNFLLIGLLFRLLVEKITWAFIPAMSISRKNNTKERCAHCSICVLTVGEKVSYNNIYWKLKTISP